MTAKQTNQVKPKVRNGKPLMSELLTDTRKYIEQAEQADVDSLRQFLFNEPKRPLIAMGMVVRIRHSNPNDPNNLGGFDKRLFRNNVRFQKDFKLYGSLSL